CSSATCPPSRCAASTRRPAARVLPSVPSCAAGASFEDHDMPNDLTPAVTFQTGWQKPADLNAAIASIQEDDEPIIVWHPRSDASMFFAGAGAMAAVILLLWLLAKLGQALRFIGEKLIDLGSRP